MPPPRPPPPTTSHPPLPTLPLLSTFLSSHLPTLSPTSLPTEVPWLYHSPQPPHLSLPLPARPVPKLILSITPTPGVYAACAASPPSSGPPALFLHRPWALARARLPRGSAVFASHKAFDEALTVGCNGPLLARLGFEVAGGGGVRVLVGYKGDAGRRVGVVARAAAGRGTTVGEVRGRVEGEFGGALEGVFGFEEVGVGGREVGVLACMNAFHAEEVERVARAVGEMGGGGGGEVVYLTGAVREEGLRAARDRGMLVVCVGHRVCESWGIGYLAGRVREEWPGLEVVVVDEEEEVVPKKKKVEDRKRVDGRQVDDEARRGETQRRQDDVGDGEEGGVAL